MQAARLDTKNGDTIAVGIAMPGCCMTKKKMFANSGTILGLPVLEQLVCDSLCVLPPRSRRCVVKRGVVYPAVNFTGSPDTHTQRNPQRDPRQET